MVFRVFVGNLAYSLNDKSFEEELKKLGITGFSEAKIASNRSGRSWGFGFVLFDKEEDAKKAIAENGKELAGRKARIEMAFDEKTVKENKEKRIHNSKSLFVGGFPEKTQQKDLESIFSDLKYVSCNLIMTREDECRGFGFVAFETHEDAEKAMAEVKGTKVNDKEIIVEYARPMRRRPVRRGVKPAGTKKAAAPKKTFAKKAEKPTPKPKERKPRVPASERVKDEKVVYVGNVSFKAEDADLAEFFKDYKPKEARVVKTSSGRNKGFGFVVFDTPEDAQKALALNAKVMMERELRCAIAYKKIEPETKN